jgi:Flp pilus assembly protein TadD
LLAAVAGIIVFSAPAQAQTSGTGEAPGAALRRQLTELAANPTSVAELIETGRAALAVGDGEAALGFFTRAGELSPRDPKVKAGLAAANVRNGQPETALALFSEAVALGAPVAEIAGERGLAYDLVGQTARAQQDYLVSLRSREDPEVRRRLALSLAISGQREAALRLLEDQVRQGDRAGNRARVMVLALSGDVRGATAAANQTLPPQAAQAITPFFSRLAALSPAQMASAANLGRAPSSGIARTATAATAATADPGALAFAGGGTAAAPALRTRLPVAAAPPARRGGGAVATAARGPGPARGTSPSARTNATAGARSGIAVGTRTPMRTDSPALASSSAPSVPAQASRSGPGSALTAAASALPSLPASFLQPHPHQPLRLAGEAAASGAAMGGPPPEQQGRPEPVELAGVANAEPRIPAANLSTPIEAALAGAAPAETRQTAQGPVQLSQSQQPAWTLPQAGQQPAPAPLDGAAANLATWNGASLSTVQPAQPAAPRPAFSQVVAAVSSLPTETPPAPAPSGARPNSTLRNAPTDATRPRTNAAASSTAATRPPATARPPQQAHPSRVWVQLGVSQNRSAFAHDLSRIRRAAPELLRDRTPHVAPIGSNSNRLLVGPFPTEAAARTFVNGLKQKDIQSLTWTSPAGTQVERLPAGR